MKPNCIRCSGPLRLVEKRGHTYQWECETRVSGAVNGCIETVDTGVPRSCKIAAFQNTAIRDDQINTELIGQRFPIAWVPAVRVYMPQILYHFIECGWGACYNSVYLYSIAPFLESAEVVDYVLRSPVIHGGQRGLSGALIYDELAVRLLNVRSPIIKEYISRNFPDVDVTGRSLGVVVPSDITW